VKTSRNLTDTQTDDNLSSLNYYSRMT